ncbi:tetratricopeptide repeat protein [Spongorhabdus nitratireducens]
MNLETAKMLADIGFMASAYQQRPAAHAIFTALIANYPDNSVPYNGMAHLHIMTGMFDDAVNLLKGQADSAEEIDPMTLALLCAAYKMAGKNDDSEDLLNKIKNDYPDTNHFETTQGLIKIFESTKEVNAKFTELLTKGQKKAK